MLRCAVVVAAMLHATSADAGQFYGIFGLGPNTADATGKTRLLRFDFGFEDAGGLRWQTNAGDVTDGASIPTIFRPLIGDPFEDRFVRAAVIHDRYCDPEHNVRPWRDTHRVFYDALITSGVPKLKAKIMYYAVYSFGPRWDKLSPGIDCGPNCVQAMADFNVFYRPEDYEDPANLAELETAAAKIEEMERTSGVTLDAIEAMSDARRPEDIFLLYSVAQ